MQQQPQQVQTHHQVVEEILPDQMSDEVTKEVINQFLPQRKRKPRQPKAPGKQAPQKIIKLEPQASGSVEQTVVQTVEQGMIEQGSEMIVEEEQEQVGGELIEQVVSGEEHLKSEIKTEDGDQSNVAGGSPSKTPKTPKDKSNSKLLINRIYR